MAGREFLPGDARQHERAYSPAIKVSGGTTIYLAGYRAFQDQAGKSYAGDFDGQVREVFAYWPALLATVTARVEWVDSG